MKWGGGRDEVHVSICVCVNGESVEMCVVEKGGEGKRGGGRGNC